MKLLDANDETMAPNGETIKRDEEGRYRDALGRYGYSAHFTGAYVCYSCGVLCECGEWEE
jgi:hypothetical protein